MITLAQNAEFQQTIQKSRFIARAAAVTTPEEALDFLAKAREPEATHNCWAYKVGQQYRFSDDGEPSGTAGRPILSVIEGQGLDGVMMVVTRYFGGVKLGAGGLIRAYGGVAAECLRQAPRRQVVPMLRVRIEAPFEYSNSLFHLVQGLSRASEEYTEHGLCMVLELEESSYEELKLRLHDATRGKVNLTRLP